MFGSKKQPALHWYDGRGMRHSKEPMTADQMIVVWNAAKPARRRASLIKADEIALAGTRERLTGRKS